MRFSLNSGRTNALKPSLARDGAAGARRKEPPENTRRIPREYEENTKRIRWQHASTWLASGLQVACKWLVGGFAVAVPSGFPPKSCLARQTTLTYGHEKSLHRGRSAGWEVVHRFLPGGAGGQRTGENPRGMPSRLESTSPVRSAASSRFQNHPECDSTFRTLRSPFAPSSTRSAPA